ncbi:hypothetical protein BKA93DRAFT_828937 [Sparassis latifolia]
MPSPSAPSRLRFFAPPYPTYHRKRTKSDDTKPPPSNVISLLRRNPCPGRVYILGVFNAYELQGTLRILKSLLPDTPLRRRSSSQAGPPYSVTVPLVLLPHTFLGMQYEHHVTVIIVKFRRDDADVVGSATHSRGSVSHCAVQWRVSASFRGTDRLVSSPSELRHVDPSSSPPTARVSRDTGDSARSSRFPHQTVHLRRAPTQDDIYSPPTSTQTWAVDVRYRPPVLSSDASVDDAQRDTAEQPSPSPIHTLPLTLRANRSLSAACGDVPSDRVARPVEHLAG